MTRRGLDAVQVGQSGSYTRLVAEDEVARFVDVSGDDNALHVNAGFAKATRFGERIAHGALLVGFMSAAFTDWWRRHAEGQTEQLAISYGYDRIRFIRPVHMGETVTVEHRIVELAPAEDKAFADVTCVNQDGTLVAVARHIVKFV